MEKENPSPYSAPPAEFFAREMERLRALPPRFVHVESYIEACLTQWETRYPQSAGVDTEARRLGNEVLDQVLRKMNVIAEEARQDFAAAEKDPEECREYYALIEELIDRAGGLAEWEKTDLGTDLVLLYVDKWKALQQEARTALELQDEELEIDEDDAAASRPLRATWQDTLCSFTPFLFFLSLVFFFVRFKGAEVPAAAANLWDKWAALTPTVGVWVVVPAVLFFVAAVVSLCRGLKKLFAAAKPSPLEALKLWAPLLVSYVGSGVEQLFHIRNGFFTPVLTYGFDPATNTTNWAATLHAACVAAFVVLPILGVIVLLTYVFKTVSGQPARETAGHSTTDYHG